MLHILLVEDLSSEREILATAFEHRGVRVSAVGTDADAYAAIRGEALNSFAAIVTDVNLGQGTTGFDVARAARSARPDVPVIYMTAYDVVMDPHLVPDCLTLRKPIRLTEVADAVVEYLQERNVAAGQGQASSA